VNRLWRTTKGGKMYISKQYANWKSECQWLIKSQTKNAKILGPYKLTLLVVAPDKRHRDIDNLFKAINDILQLTGVVENDKFCHWIEGRWVKNGNPCTVIIEGISQSGEQNIP